MRHNLSKETRETVYSVLVKKGLRNSHEIATFLNGKRVEVISSVGNHNYGSVGTKFTVDIVPGYESCNQLTGNYLNGPTSNGISMKYLVIVAQTVDELTQELNECENNIKEIEIQKQALKAKIKFMKDNSLKEFDDTDFKVYAVLKVLEKGASTLDTAKAISKLIKES